MENKKLFLIVNPKSGRARVKTELLGIVSVFSENGCSVEVYPTKCHGDATRVMAELTGDYDMVVCCGGDGTLSEVISGFISGGKSYKLGYIPLGTVNEWSTTMGIPKNASAAAKAIINGEVFASDIGKFGDEYFVYTASFGAFTEASYSAPQGVKNAIGHAAYAFEAVKAVPNIKPIHLKFELDSGETIEGNYLYGGISNSLSCGGVIHLDKEKVKFNDGLFELVLIEDPGNVALFGETVNAVLSRQYDNCPCIVQRTAKKVTVYGCEDLPWTLDGEMAKSREPLTIEVLPQAVNFVIPKK